jgi:FkbM family methyltransferase
MNSLQYKAQRVQNWTPIIGLQETLKFEILWSLGLPQIQVNVPGYPTPFLIRKRNSDIFVFETVFIKQEFSEYLPPNPAVIIDGGANVGFSTAFYAHHYSNAVIVAVEPSSTNCALLQQNCAAFNNILVVEGGIWHRSGFLRLVDPNAPAWALQCEEAQQGEAGAFPAYSIQDLLKQVGKERCDLLKLDVEGAEEYLFSSETQAWLPLVDAILVEVHGEKAEQAIKSACPENAFDYEILGEKLFITHKSTVNQVR